MTGTDWLYLDGLRGTDGHAGTAAGTGLVIYEGHRDALRLNSERDGFGLTGFTATAAYHLVVCQASISDDGELMPGSLGQLFIERAGMAVIDTGFTECALTLVKIQGWKSTATRYDNVLGTSRLTVATTSAHVKKCCAINRPRWQ